MADSLVVYYSRSGHTKRVAEQLSKKLGADLEEIHDTQKRSGVRGYLRSGFEAFTRRHTQLEKPRHNPSGYRRVIVGGPVWNASVSVPVRTYLMENRNRLGDTSFFVTFGGSGSKRAFRQMTKLLGHQPKATVAIREGELVQNKAERKIRTFAEILQPGAQPVAAKRAVERGRKGESARRA